MFYSTIMKIDSIDRLRDIRDALLVEQGINPTRQGEQAIKVVVERIDEIQATLDKSATKPQQKISDLSVKTCYIQQATFKKKNV